MSDKAHGILLFASPTQLKSIIHCQVLTIDSTFKLTPKTRKGHEHEQKEREFYQIFTVHGLVCLYIVCFNFVLCIFLYSIREKAVKNGFYLRSV